MIIGGVLILLLRYSQAIFGLCVLEGRQRKVLTTSLLFGWRFRVFGVHVETFNRGGPLFHFYYMTFEKTVLYQVVGRRPRPVIKTETFL